MKKKVLFTANWASPENITERLITQYKTSEEDVSNIEFVFDDSYDVLVAFNYITTPIKDDTIIYIIPAEPSWSGNHVKCHHYVDGLTYFGYKKELYGCGIENNVVETPATMFYGGTGNEKDDWTYHKVMGYGNNKTKKISSAISMLSTKMSDTCLYPERSAIIKYLIENGYDTYIDIYGGWKEELGHPRKINTVLPYMFSLSVENESIKNFHTEKLLDCIATLTVPIYFGTTNLKEIWGEKGYINIHDINDHDSISNLLKDIYNNSEDVYREHYPYLVKMREKMFTELNPLKKINELLK